MVGRWQAPWNVQPGMAVGGEGIQSRGMTESPELLREEGRPRLTSSEYWTSSMAYFSLKCSLGWILKKKHKEHQGQVLAAVLPPDLGHEAPGPPLPQWHWAPSRSTQQRFREKGHWAME